MPEASAKTIETLAASHHIGPDGRVPSSEAFGFTALLLAFREVAADAYGAAIKTAVTKPAPETHAVSYEGGLATIILAGSRSIDRHVPLRSQGNMPMPGNLITDRQVRRYMDRRKKDDGQPVAAAKAGFSERTARRVDIRSLE